MATQADLDAINAAISTGAAQVELPGSGRVVYRGLKEMLAIKAKIETELASTQGKTPIRRVKVTCSKDL